ncbi:fiber [Ovine adenovirus 8]|uniref:Fiber n=1 Tax=Ovine adenovirus 8 TaxID=2601527 RepID=A0A5B8MAV1_9ADEN|nr:fiber [Ovine adenovirus 8]QDZ17476.1 fiber [Ovine adenovirus 8]
MKRVREGPINPVYPYTRKRLHIMPPFYATQGFEESRDATLTLRIERPLSFDAAGRLIVRVGRGLRLHPDTGALEANDLASSISPPLAQDKGGNVSLAIGSGLIVDENGRLDLNRGPGLSLIAPEGPVRVLTGPGLRLTAEGQVAAKVPDRASVLGIDQDGNLRVRLGPPFQANEYGRLVMQVGEGLWVVNNRLRVRLAAHSGLKFSTGNLSANLGDGLDLDSAARCVVRLGDGLQFVDGRVAALPGRGLAIQEGRLETRAGDGLQLSDAGLAVRLGTGLGLSAEKALQLDLRAANGLAVADGVVRANLGQGLHLVGDRITVRLGDNLRFSADGAITTTAPLARPEDAEQAETPAVTVSAPLTASNNRIGLSFREGLQVVDDALTVKVGPGLEVTNAGVTPRLGDYLAIDTEGRLRVDLPAARAPPTEAPLHSRAGSLALDVGPGLQVADGRLAAKAGPGVRVNPETGEISVLLGSGLTFGESRVRAGRYDVRLQVSNPFAFAENGALAISVGSGLRVNGSRLEANTGRGIAVDRASKQMRVVAGRGLEYVEEEETQEALGVKLGRGLRFDNRRGAEVAAGPGLGYDSSNQSLTVQLGAGLMLSGQTIVSNPHYHISTLWTGTVPRNNVTWVGYTNPSSKLYLRLTRFSTGLVLGTLSIHSDANGHYVENGSPNLTVYVLLANDGNLRSGSNVQGTWEIKGAPGNSRAAFLPSASLYPHQSLHFLDSREAPPAHSLTTYVAHLGKQTGSVHVTVGLNRRRSADTPPGPSLIFYYTNFQQARRNPFSHSNITFTYWTD